MATMMHRCVSSGTADNCPEAFPSWFYGGLCFRSSLLVGMVGKTPVASSQLRLLKHQTPNSSNK
jgi:hypothetical protein